MQVPPSPLILPPSASPVCFFLNQERLLQSFAKL
jgi:hypothetical protein